VRFTVSAGAGAVCAFTNRLVYSGSIAIEKETINGRGTAAFTISPLANPAIQRRQFAKVKKPRSPASAKGQSTAGLPYGTYVIREYAGPGQTVRGWSLIMVACGGDPVPFEQGRIEVRLTPNAPHAVCRFVNLFAPHQAKLTPPARVPPEPGGSEPDVSVEKELVGKTEGPEPVLSFRIVVKNRAKVAASNVSVTENPGRGMRIKSVRPEQGTCLRLAQLVCALGTIQAADQTSIIVQTESSSADPTVNQAVVGSGSPDATVSNDQAAVRVVPPKPRAQTENNRGRRGHHSRGACSSSAVAHASWAVAHASC
jgi:hypothetical protein